MELLVDLDERLFQKYLDHKRKAVDSDIEQGMFTGLFDWEQCAHEPDEIRSYIHEIVLSLVAIHCEVGKMVAIHCEVGN